MAGTFGFDFSNLFGGDKGTTDMGAYSGRPGTYQRLQTLTPEQQRLMSQVGSYYSNAFSGGGFPQYTGEYNTPITGGEQDLVRQNSRSNVLAEKGFAPLLSGEFPEDYYQKSVYAPTMKSWREDILPELEESYAGPGGYWGSARAGAVGKSARDLSDYLTSTRADLANKAVQYPTSAAPAYANYMGESAKIQSIPRAIRDYGLQKQYEEFVRTRPESAANIAGATSFLNLKGFGYGYVPQNPTTSSIGGGMDIQSMLPKIWDTLKGWFNTKQDAGTGPMEAYPRDDSPYDYSSQLSQPSSYDTDFYSNRLSQPSLSPGNVDKYDYWSQMGF